MTQNDTIKRALKILDQRMRRSDALSSPDAVRDYLRLLLHDRSCVSPEQPAAGLRTGTQE